MKTVGYSHSFIINGEWTKIWTEEELPPEATSEEKRKKWYELKNEVHGFFWESVKAAEKQKEVIAYEPKMTLTSVRDLIKEINFCNSYDLLQKEYKFIVQKDADLQLAYDKRLEQLKKIEVQQILTATNNYRSYE